MYILSQGTPPVKLSHFSPVIAIISSHLSPSISIILSLLRSHHVYSLSQSTPPIKQSHFSPLVSIISSHLSPLISIISSLLRRHHVYTLTQGTQYLVIQPSISTLTLSEAIMKVCSDCNPRDGKYKPISLTRYNRFWATSIVTYCHSSSLIAAYRHNTWSLYINNFSVNIMSATMSR